jgi:Brp/Blh family beta-carotene 15,15'-monooxygenase
MALPNLAPIAKAPRGHAAPGRYHFFAVNENARQRYAGFALRLWILPLTTLTLICLNATIGLNSLWATMLAAVAIVICGIPHGTLDIDIAANRFARTDVRGKAGITAAYLVVAALMVSLWMVQPALALIIFLLVSIIHFAADWQSGDDRFLGAMVGWALIALPAITHDAEVAAIFQMLTSSNSGSTVAALLACSAVPPALGTMVYCYWRWTLGDRINAVDVAACMVAAIMLPSLIAFMLFFCGLHSPRHMADALRESEMTLSWPAIAKIAAVFALSLGIGAVLFHTMSVGQNEAGIIRAAFVLISVLTAPHFLLEHAIRR